MPVACHAVDSGPAARTARRVAAAGLAVALASAVATPARAESTWRKEKGEVHGSQVASSEWLPIVIGGAAGVVVGGLAGTAFDTEPALVGPIAGGVLGGLTGGAAGAWLIRSAREQDTRLAGTLTGLGVGAGVAAVLFAKTEPNDRALETVGKWSALVVVPALGALAGYRLAIVFGSTQTKEAPPAPPPVAFVRPNVAPVGTGGLAFGIDGAF